MIYSLAWRDEKNRRFVSFPKGNNMNASAIVNDNMTLEEKLEAIEMAMKEAQATADAEAKKRGEASAPIDPADLTMCEGCQ